MPDITPLGKKIEKAMREKGITLKILANDKIVTGNTLTKIKTGGSVNPTKRDKLLQYLGLGGGNIPVVVGNFIEEKDRQIQHFVGKMSMVKDGDQVVIGGVQYVKHACAMCKGDGFLWVPIN